jgi:hypothetical protein
MGDGLAAAVTGVVGTFRCHVGVGGDGFSAPGWWLKEVVESQLGVPVTRPAFGQSSIAATPAWFSPCDFMLGQSLKPSQAGGGILQFIKNTMISQFCEQFVDRVYCAIRHQVFTASTVINRPTTPRAPSHTILPQTENDRRRASTD